MYIHLFAILIGSNLLLLSTCLIIHKHRVKDSEETCLDNYFRSITTNYLRPCYIDNYRDRSIFVWFTIEQSLFHIFRGYRFVLRSIDEISLSTINVHILTNFTQLIDANNSLHILNLDPGLYEVCVDFQSYSTSYIYSPRNGCVFIRRTELLNSSFKQNSTQLVMASIVGIILFLIVTVCFQLIKLSRREKDDSEQRIKRSMMLSSKKQRNHLLRKLFRRHTNDQPDSSRLRQWIPNRVFRKYFSIKKLSRQTEQISTKKKVSSQKNLPSPVPTSTTNDIYTIPMNRFSFYLTPSEEFEFI
ncbi:unnamed protein product [Rotaria socialis]|uniref:Uncharacterized protein n=1 Tax=Rotaria socialis TaxID=392032 RepID=A0A818IF04_9BILA|nr:unnamed protein product [Rotaria socialis]CAF3461690.1 unnamed protein product [Rotaria socialis]CAF3466064.1 unnamed protein product [Rotaria socialis]CAF3518748.1 unnamed protein product [Rotaria socialis]CAF3592532.1 unnamed protein product [Rotaria socialis]